jgi:hypothetical protein
MPYILYSFNLHMGLFLWYLNLSMLEKTIHDLNSEKMNRFLNQNSYLRASYKNRKKITIFKYAFVIFVTCRYHIDNIRVLLFLVILIYGSYKDLIIFAGYLSPYSYMFRNYAIELKNRY